MNILLLSKLQCPYCSEPFHRLKGYAFFDKKKKNIRFGEVSCLCDVFPIAEGILYLKKENYKNRLAVNFLREKNFFKATNILFDEKKRAKLPYFLFLSFFTKGLLLPFSLFISFLKFFNPENSLWFEHMKNRWKRPAFFLSLTSLSYSKKTKLFIDIGCSLNWFFSFFPSRFIESSFIGIDYSWSALLLAKKYFVSKGTLLICADVNLGVPLKKTVADSITVNDTFMYIQKKKFVLEEFLRVGKKNLHVFLTHVHNDGEQNAGQGYGLSTSELQQYLALFQIWLVSDKDLFQSILKNETQPYQKLEKNFSFKKDSPSYSYILFRSYSDTAFTPQKTLPWVITLAKKTNFDYKEDIFLCR